MNVFFKLNLQTSKFIVLSGTPLYEFVHQGHCASGWDKGPNNQYPTILQCRNECDSRPGMLYFAYREGNNCACYSSCADDGKHDDHNAYKIIKGNANNEFVIIIL